MSDDNSIFNITSNNQSGGITAGVVNIGQEQRVMDEQFQQSLLAEISKLLLTNQRKIEVGIVSGADGETIRFHNEIKKFLLDSGINVSEGFTTFYPSNPIFGVKINIQNPNKIAIMIGPKEL